MVFALDGLISGLDTTTMINQLMTLAARPQAQLQTKVKDTQSFVSALQQLNTRVSTLGSTAEKISKAGALDLYSATSSSPAATAKASTGASTGAIDFVVDKLAQAQVDVSKTLTEWPADVPALTITTGGVSTEFDTSGKSLDEVVALVNKSDIGVTAMKVAAGTDPGGTAQYRLQFSSTKTGSAGGFSIAEGTAADVEAGAAANFLSVESGAVPIRAAQDAEVRLWAGTGAEQTITSSSNTFTKLLPGVDVTVSAASESPVTLKVARDDKAISKTASDLVAGLADLFSYISTNSSVTPATAADGTASTTAGPFTSDSAVRDIAQRILTAATGPVDGRSPSEIGISITKDGTVEFDADKFGVALKENPSKVQATLQEIATRVTGATAAMSNSKDGGITVRIQSQQSSVKDLNTQIASWDQRLDLRRSTLTATWANLEVQLSKLKSQGSWLSAQLANMPNTGSTSS